jgi:hypothetical protein
MARIQYTSETSRIMRTDSAMMDVDVSGCFDRMPPRLPAIVNQTNESLQASASCQTEVTYRTKHRFKTKTGKMSRRHIREMVQEFDLRSVDPMDKKVKVCQCNALIHGIGLWFQRYYTPPLSPQADSNLFMC